MKKQIKSMIGPLIYLLLTILPVAYLLATGSPEPVSFSGRRLGLMENSLLIACSVSLLCMLISIFASLRLYDGSRKRPIRRWFFLLTAPVPSYIYALSYMNLIRAAGRFFPQLLRYRMAGMVPCILVEILSFLPLACAAALIGLEQMDVREWKAAILFQGADKAFFRVVLPGQFPYVLAMGAVIFVLSITDYSIPSLFQVNVYAMEIFSDYSAAGESAHSMMLSGPLLAAALMVLLPALYPLKNVPTPQPVRERLQPRYSVGLRAAGTAMVVLLVLQILFPVLSLVPYIGSLPGETVSAAEELWNSCLTGALAVLLMLVPSAGMALRLRRGAEREEGAEGHGKRMACFLLWAVAVLPMAVPGVLSGIGVLKLISDSPLHMLRGGVLMPAIGMAIRYLPFGMLIGYGCYIRMDLSAIRAAQLLQPRKGKALLLVQLRLMAPGLIASGIAVFLLTLGDVGTALILMPAGMEPLSVKIYNYLHYGSSETVAAFCLLQVMVCMLMMGILYAGTQAHHKRIS